MANEIISRFNFLVHGEKFPKGISNSKRIKGATVSAETVFGYVDYLDNGHGYVDGEYQEFLKENEGYAGYMARDAAIDNKEELFKRYPSTFTHNGTFTKDDNGKYSLEYAQTLKEMKDCFDRDGKCIWIPIVSLVDYDFAKNMHMYSDKDYSAVLNSALPRWYRSVGLDPDNMYWLANYHNNTGHPHIHFMMMEKETTRLRKTFSLKDIQNLKAYIGSDMAKRARYLKNAYDEAIIPLHKQMDETKKEVHQQVDNFLIKNEDDQIRKDIVRLFYNIDLKAEGTGSLKYNSKNMRPYRKKIDNIISKILNHEVNKELYTELMNKWKELDDKTKGEFIKTPINYQENENKKLYSRIGNFILKHKSDYDIWLSEYKKVIGKFDERKVRDAAIFKETRCYDIEKNNDGFDILFKDERLEKSFVFMMNNINFNQKNYFQKGEIKAGEYSFKYQPNDEDKKSLNTKFKHFTIDKAIGFMRCCLNNIQDGKDSPLNIRQIINTDFNSDKVSIEEFQQSLNSYIKKNKDQPDNFYYVPKHLDSHYRDFGKYNNYKNNNLSQDNQYSKNYFVNSINKVLSMAHITFGDDVKKAMDDYNEQIKQEEENKKWEEELSAYFN